MMGPSRWRAPSVTLALQSLAVAAAVVPVAGCDGLFDLDLNAGALVFEPGELEISAGQGQPEMVGLRSASARTVRWRAEADQP